MDHITVLPLRPLKGGSETLLLCFTNKTDILLIKRRYKVSLHDAPIVWLKMQFCDFANEVAMGVN